MFERRQQKPTLTRCGKSSSPSRLVQFGFKSIDEFRVKGLKQLGRRNFTHYRKILSNFGLGGLELIVFGFDETGRPRFFEVHQPGRIVNIAVQGYSVVGGGYSMAVASLRQSPC